MNLIDYIKGYRKGKKAHRIEREAMQDSFLSDALDGYNQTKGDHAHRLEELRLQIESRSRTPRHALRNWSIAASVMIVLLGGSYLLWMQAPQMLPDTTLGSIPEVKRPDTTGVAVQPTDSIIKAQPKREVLAQEKPKKTLTPAPVEEESVMEEEEEASIAKVQKSLTTRETSAAMKTISTPGIQGKVTDKESGEPLTGVSVLVKGSNQGTVTDLDGNFNLQTNDKNLVVQYIGYEPLEIKPDTSSNLLIAMAPSKQTLDEVVVVGYGITVKPEPIIGNKAYRKYLKKNLKRPADGECQNSKGKVVLSFYIDKDGVPTEINIEQSLCEDADREAIRLIKEGPAWKQGSAKGTVEVDF